MSILFKDPAGMTTPIDTAGGQEVQETSLPTASEDLLGKVYQYTGATTQDYIHNYFYECMLVNGAYTWVNTLVQESGSGQTIQVTELPAASASNVDFIYQYIGASTSTLTNGFFYRCVSDGQNPATYFWAQVDTQPTTPVATDNTVGMVKPDGETIIIDPDGTIHALGGGGGIHLANVSGATATSNKCVVSLKWSDPPDVVVSGITLAEWAGTKVLRKVGAAPTGVDDEDATLIIDSTTRNAYSSTPLEDNTVSYETQYYYKFFPYTVDELYTSGSAVGIVPEREVISTVPSQSGRLEYTGESQSPTWNNYNSDELTIGGTTSGTAVDTYTATFTPKSDYMWDDGTQDAVDVTWAISNITISAVPTQDGTLSYTGESQSPTWNGYDTDVLTISGDTSGTAIGTYTAVFTPKTNYEWWDGTTTGKDVEWSIGEAIITTVPTQQGTLTYDGTEQTAVWNNFDVNQLTIANGTGTNAGTYTASFTPKSGYKWSDGTTTAKTADFVIGKAEGSVTLSTNNVSLDDNHLSVNVTITSTTGNVSATVNDPTIATVTITNQAITVNATQKAGSTTIVVNVAESENYNLTTANIDVTADFLMPKDWKDGVNQGTDAEIRAMLTAADAGTLDLSLYWSIGDTRTVRLSAITVTADNAFSKSMAEQDLQLTLMNEGYMNQANIHFVVGVKNYMSEYACINKTEYNTGSWGESLLRLDLNTIVYNAFPSTLRPIFKDFVVTTQDAYNTTDLQQVTDKVALFAEKEIIGERGYSGIEESDALSHIEYFKTQANRDKGLIWWTRSLLYGRNDKWLGVRIGGDIANYYSVYSAYIVPFMCI